MNKDELLLNLVTLLTKDPDVVSIPQWFKLIMVGQISDSHARINGYCFDATGEWEAAAPFGSDPFELLQPLRDAMQLDSPTGRPWVSCLLRIGRNGAVGADFEYADPDRWSITPANYEQRIAEFAAMPV